MPRLTFPKQPLEILVAAGVLASSAMGAPQALRANVKPVAQVEQVTLTGRVRGLNPPSGLVMVSGKTHYTVRVRSATTRITLNGSPSDLSEVKAFLLALGCSRANLSATGLVRANMSGTLHAMSLAFAIHDSNPGCGG